MNNRFYILIITCLLIGCTIKDNPIKRFENELKEYDKRLVDHFPIKSNYKFITASFLKSYKDSEDKNGKYVKMMYSLTKSELDELVEDLRESAKAIINHKDSCSLIINRSDSYEYMNNSKNCESYKPLPTFFEEKDRFYEQNDYLPDEYKIYLLDFGNKLIIDESITSEPTKMPERWKHGFSKGVAINENLGIGIFWIDIW